MPLTQYLVASSLDGFIADEHDNLDWLLSMPGGDDDANPYPAFIKDVGALAMGATTYEWINRAPPRPVVLRDRPTWVFTHRDLPVIEGANLIFTADDVREVHAAMVEAAGGRNVWLVGGGRARRAVPRPRPARRADRVGDPGAARRGARCCPAAAPSRCGCCRRRRHRRSTFVHLHYTLR